MKILRGTHKKGNREQEFDTKGELPHSLYPPHENRKIESKVR